MLKKSLYFYTKHSEALEGEPHNVIEAMYMFGKIWVFFGLKVLEERYNSVVGEEKDEGL